VGKIRQTPSHLFLVLAGFLVDCGFQRRSTPLGGCLKKLSLLSSAAVALLCCGCATVPAAGGGKTQSGIASIYGYKGGRTASGQRAVPSHLTAAHRSLPFGTMVQVTNRHNGRTVVVRINDRGPFVRGRVIDLTPAAANALGFSGLAPVSLSVVK
jgi:rare lipoprotein A